MKKICLSLMIIFAIVFMIVSCDTDHKEDTDEELAFITEPDENVEGLKITGYKGELPKELTIPEEIDGQKVVSIGDAFNNEDIISVELPNTMEYIYGGAFDGCKSLTTLKFNSSVGFWDLHYEGIPAFVECPVENLTCYGGVFEMEQPSFLKTVKHLTIIGGSVDMSEYTKDNCPNLETIYFDKNSTGASEGAFYGMTSIKSVMCHEESEIYFTHGTFSQCTELETVVLSKKIERIDFAVFGGSGIKEIVIPASVKEIGRCAFYNSSLETVTFEDVNGWYIVSEEKEEALSPEIVANPQMMATYLRDANESYFIKK